MLTSSDPTGGAGTWTTAHVDDHALLGVSCQASGLCVVTDDAGNVLTSTDPAAGAGAWTIRNVAGSGLGNVSCPSTTLCVAAGSGGVAASTDPTGPSSAWRLTRLRNGGSITGLSCPTTSLCVVVSCPSDRLCVAVDSEEAGKSPVVSGNALTSTDPAGPARQAAKPGLLGASLSGTARGTPRLAFTVAAGILPGRTTHKLTIGSPNGVRLSQRERLGIRVSGKGGKRLKFTARIRGGVLTITLDRAVSSARVTIARPAIQVSNGLAHQVKVKQLGQLTFALRITDAGRVATARKLKLKAS